MPWRAEICVLCDYLKQGNEIIERIQNESRTLKAKMRMKAKIIKQQEQVCYCSTSGFAL